MTTSGSRTVTGWCLVDGAYVEDGSASGDQTLELTLPFPASVTPSQLR